MSSQRRRHPQSHPWWRFACQRKASRPLAGARPSARPGAGCALIAPALAIVGVFILYPLVFGVYISFTDWPLSARTTTSAPRTIAAILHNSAFIDSIGSR